MRHLILGLVLLLPPALPGGLSGQEVERRNLSGEVIFDARATLGDFSGHTRAIAGAIRLGGRLDQTRGWLEVPVRAMRTGNASRDQEMRELLGDGGHPAIRFEITDVAVGMPDGDSIPVTVRGGFTVHGVTRTHAVSGWAWRRRGGAIRFRGQTVLRLSEFGLRRPGLLLGMLRMRDPITIRMDLTVGG